MNKIRILVVDDSVLIRKLMTDILFEDEELNVVGAAANGRLALSMIPQLNPDLITLDFQMPELNGMETLVELRKQYPRLPVVMVSSYTEKGAVETIEALSRGANDYVQKPSQTGSFESAKKKMKTELIPKIKALFPARNGNAQINPIKNTTKGTVIEKPRSAPAQMIDVVTIGCSTGGPNALTEVLSHIPSDFPVPIVIVQHMPPLFTKSLADRLNAVCPLSVKEAVAGENLDKGSVWIAPGDFHLGLKREGVFIKLVTHQAPPENSCRPSVDVLFRSVGEVFGGRTLGVVLTGMGQDGLRGCEKIRSMGGQILAQDEATSVVWGMPGAVANAGLADKILPIEQISQEIVFRVKRGQSSVSSPSHL